MVKCSKCGKDLSSAEKFCPKCGSKNNEYSEDLETLKRNVKNPRNILKSKILLIIGLVLIIAIIVVVIVLATREPDKEEEEESISFKRIYRKIDGDGYYVELASDNSYLKVDTNPLDLDDFSASEGWNMIQSINEELDLPESLEQKMGQTRSIDGRMSQEFDDVIVSWTYHPNSGLEVLYEMN